MRSSLIRLFSITLILSSVLTPIPAQAASPYDNAPADIKSFENSLLKKLLIVKYGQVYGIGFAGSYSISQETKDTGVNSIIITTNSTLSPNNDVLKGCFLRGADRRVSLTSVDKNFEGECLGLNADGTDFAVISTTVSLPTIQLYDPYWPKQEGWIDVAYYVEGFGIMFRPSRIKLINEKLYVFAIEKFTPTMNFTGMAFNSLGNFVGTVSPFGPGTVPADYFKLNGAPLQCGWENSSATITNCNTRTNVAQSARLGVWTIDSPSTSSVATTPSPKPTVDSGPNEISDANDAVSDALSTLLEVVDTCESLAGEIRELLGDFQVANPLLDKCGTLDGKYAEIDSKRAQAFTGSASSNAKVDALNKLTDQALVQVDAAELVVAQLQDAEPIFESIARDLLKYSIDFATTAEEVANLNNRISGLPKTLRSMIMKNSSYKKLAAVFPTEYDIEQVISESLPDLSSISTMTQLANGQNLILQARKNNGTAFNAGSSLKAVEKLIPKYVCVKGKTVSVTPATGKCAPGSTKTATS
jgi:hypothetical protein